MKKVVLLGDSIRLLGYGKRTAELLGSDITVWQPEDNCRFASSTLRMLYDYADAIRGADVVHFNCGLWDMCDLFGDGPFTPLDEYVHTLVRIVRVLKTYIADGGRIIFALSTVPSPDMWGHSWQRVADYNAAAVAALEKEGVLFNDLCTPVREDVAHMLSSDLIHLSEQGVEICAGQTAGAIRAALQASCPGTD